MSREYAEIAEQDGLSARLYDDDSPTSPRDWDNLGTFVNADRNYAIGDENVRDFEPEDVRDEYGDGVLVFVRLDDYGASGGRLHECDYDEDHANGYFYVTRERILAEYGHKIATASDRANALRCVVAEIEEMNRYVCGENYGVVIVDEQGETVDSCWGFIGYEWASEEALRMLADAVETRRRDRQEHTKKMIRGHVPLMYRALG